MKKILSILFIHLTTSYNLCMDNTPKKRRSPDNAPQSANKRKRIRKKISPFKTLSYPQAFGDMIKESNIRYYGGKCKENEDRYTEIIDIRTKAPIAGDTFGNLIKERTQQNKPYFLATVLVDEGTIKNKDTQEKIQHLGRRYHDAAYLIGWLFNRFKRRNNRKHPLTNQNILEPIHFFRINSLSGHAHYFASERDLQQNNDRAAYMYALLKSKMGKPHDLFHLAEAYHYALGSKLDYKKAKYYYTACINQGFSDSINGLGDLYITQKNYKKAEEQYLRGAQNYHTLAQLNLVYLFVIDKSNLDINTIISWFFTAQQEKEEFEDYTKKYPGRWEKIKQMMQAMNIEIPNNDNDEESGETTEKDDNNDTTDIQFPPIPDDEDSQEPLSLTTAPHQ